MRGREAMSGLFDSYTVETLEKDEFLRAITVSKDEQRSDKTDNMTFLKVNLPSELEICLPNESFADFVGKPDAAAALAQLVIERARLDFEEVLKAIELRTIQYFSKET